MPVRTYEYKIGLIQRNPGNRLIHSRGKKIFESPPPEPQCSDRSQTSNTGSGWPTCFDILRALAESARTKRYDPKQTKNSQIIYIPVDTKFSSGTCLREWRKNELKNIQHAILYHTHMILHYNCMKYICCSTCGSIHVSHCSRDPQAYRS